jgi:hypothetical protein
MNADGYNQARFTDNQELGFKPPRSPDGTKTTFYSTPSSNLGVYLMDTADSV